MKTKLCMLAVLCIVSCNEDISNKDIYLKNIALSLCKNNNELRNSNVDEYIKFSAIDNKTSNELRNTTSGKYIKFSAVDNSTLGVEENFYLNCCTEDISMKINSEENIITINITDEDGGCNCVCEKIVNYNICNLQENKTYKLIFLRNDYEYHTCELHFTKNLILEILFSI